MGRGFGVQKADLCLGKKLISWRPDFPPALNELCTVVTVNLHSRIGSGTSY